jgi:hypothetical protein
VGLPTVAKKFPFLKEEKTHYLDSILAECIKPENNQKVYANILESKELIENNYDIMQLSSPMLSIQAKQGIDDTFEQYSPHYNQTEMRKLMLQDGVLTVNTQDLDQRFNNIISSFSR